MSTSDEQAPTKTNQSIQFNIKNWITNYNSTGKKMA